MFIFSPCSVKKPFASAILRTSAPSGVSAIPMLISGALRGFGAPVVDGAAALLAEEPVAAPDAAVGDAPAALVVADAAEVALLELLLSLPHAARANTNTAPMSPGNDRRRALADRNISG